MPNFEVERLERIQQLRNRLGEVYGTVFEDARPLQNLRYCVTGPGKGPESMPKSGWKPFEVMQRWGGFDQTTWFRMRARVPKAFGGRRVVARIVPCAYTDIPGIERHEESGEALAYVNGRPWQGIDRNHRLLVLTGKAQGGENFDIALECTPLTRFDATHVFRQADFAIMRPEPWDFYWDGMAYLDVLETLDDRGAARRRLFNLLYDAIMQVDLQRRGDPAYYESLRKARRFLQRGLKRFPSDPHLGHLTLIGQSHIDTAWLWPLRETKRKVGRTWSTMLRLMEQYPEFHFSASQPELYMFAKEHHPEVYKQIKQRVKEGRWEPCGATWVEQDNNMPAGESLVRQFLYGNRFYEREFGIRSRTAWLPDAFGFCWSLPQIMKQCGVDYFFTIKISWSRFTKFPYGYFLWEGIDGTRIPAIMTPQNYNGNPIPRDLFNQREDFQQKELLDETPFPFGYGDGGGGPDHAMLEYGRRMKNIVGVPRCDFGRTEDCFARMREEVDDAALPVWNGELYLELHRGCQTSQARTKRNNRKLETLLHDAEFLGALALLHGASYDDRALWKAWRVLLTSQFHDILPGSSITEVYAQCDRDYAQARSVAASVRDRAVAAIARRVDTSGPGTPLLVFNSLSWMRNDVVHAEVELPDGPFHVLAPNGESVASQRIGENEILFHAHALPPMGYAVYRVVPGEDMPPMPGMLEASPARMENDFFLLRLDRDGRFLRLYDKFEQREVIPRGEKGNVLQLFDDRPASSDAWDIDNNFEEKQWEPGHAESLEVIEQGPVRAVVRVVRKTEKSTITQDITLYALLQRIDVNCRVEWHEQHVLMKVAFPVEVHAPRATYHIQYGAIERNTHFNTDWDRARFENPAQEWADLSEGDYGVSLLNDGKYGYDVHGHTLRLSLLRASTDPDPEADQGEHTFVYSLFPHNGDWREGAVQQGRELNVPVHAVPVTASRGRQPDVRSFADVDSDNVVLDTLKRAEDDSALIVRLYESCGYRGPVKVTFGYAPKEAAAVNLMEEDPQPLELRGNCVRFDMRPWEIKTLKVRF